MSMQLATRAIRYTELSTPDDLPNRSHRSSGVSCATSCSSEILVSERLTKFIMSIGTASFGCSSRASSCSTLSLEVDINNPHAKRVRRRMAPHLLAVEGCWIDSTNDGIEVMTRAHNSVTVQEEGIITEANSERGSVANVSLAQSLASEAPSDLKHGMAISDYTSIGSESDFEDYVPPTENGSARYADVTYTGGPANVSPGRVLQEDTLDQDSKPLQDGKGKQKSVSHSLSMRNHTDNDEDTSSEDDQEYQPLPGPHTQVVALKIESQPSTESKQKNRSIEKSTLPTQKPTTSIQTAPKPDKTKVPSPTKAEDSKGQKKPKLENTEGNIPTTLDRQKPATGTAKTTEKITQSPGTSDELDDGRRSGPKPSGAEKQKCKPGATKKGQGSGRRQ